ncbi:MAG: bacillithiol biosynthesis deacetylase BshB1 [bacterium]|nr:bacillithiol biosynthesis deacetylase BshB1 [bacterium]
MTDQKPGCDLLVISPHTDDAEIGMGGTLASLAAKGRKIWLVDLTAGELGTNASVDERWLEAKAATQVLGVQGRIQLSLPDGFLDPCERDQIDAVIWALRTFRPRWVVSAPDPVRHPDHIATKELVVKAAFLARLGELQTVAQPFRSVLGNKVPGDAAKLWITPTVLSVCPTNGTPSMIFNIDGFWEIKEKALHCFSSQFIRAENRRATMINDGHFLDRISDRAKHWGRIANCGYGEAFCTLAVPVFNDFPDQEWRS